MAGRDELAEYQAQEREAYQRRNGNGKSGPDALSLTAVADLLGLGDDHFRHVWRPTADDESPLTAETAGGLRLRWKRQRDMLKPTDLAFPALAVGKGPTKPLTVGQAQNIYRALVQACETLEQAEELAEAGEWIADFLAIAAPSVIRPKFDAAETFVVVQDFRDVEQLSSQLRRHYEHWTPPVLIDQTHRYVRRSDLATYIREVVKTKISYESLKGRVAEVGWEHHDIQLWEPEVPRGEAQKVIVRTYRQGV